MNEADGNMTLWKDENDIITLGHTKVRGPEFLPQHFMIEKHTSPKIVDISGNLIALPVCVPVNESVVEDKENSEGERKIMNGGPRYALMRYALIRWTHGGPRDDGP